jgi:hypothetical protein
MSQNISRNVLATVSDHKLADIIKQMSTNKLTVCQMHDMTIKILRELIDECRNQLGRYEIWTHIIESIDPQKDVHWDMFIAVNELPIEPARF